MHVQGSQIQWRLPFASRICLVLIGMVVSGVLLCNLLDIHWAEHHIRNWLPMQRRGANGLILGVAAVWLLGVSGQRPSLRRAAAAVMWLQVIGGLSLLLGALGSDAPTDTPTVLQEVLHPQDRYASLRLVIAPIWSAVLFGVAGLLTLHQRKPRAWLPDILAIVAMVTPLTSFFGYLFEDNPSISGQVFRRMPVHTALGFIALGGALLAMRLRHGPFAWMAESTSSARLSWVNLAYLFVVAPTLGLIRQQALHSGVWDSRTVESIVAVFTIALASASIVLSGRFFNRIEQARTDAQQRALEQERLDVHARKLAEAELQAIKDQLEERVEMRTRELASLNDQLQRDLAERERVERALKESEAQLRDVTLVAIAAVQQTVRHEPLRLLIVDDAADNRLLVQAFLRDTPWQTDLADNGQQALDLWERQHYDLILMDIQMPEMDGLVATREIRRREREAGTAPVPIIALPAHALESAREQSRAAGCDLHVTKPVRRAELIQIIQSLVQRAGPVETTAPVPAIVVEIDARLQSLVPNFLQNRATDVVSVTNAALAGDFATIALLGHSMKGSGGSYGFDAITEIGSKLEAAAEAQDSTEIAREVAELRDYLKRVEVVFT